MNAKTAKRVRRIARAYCQNNEKANYRDAYRAMKKFVNQLPWYAKQTELDRAEYQVQAGLEEAITDVEDNG